MVLEHWHVEGAGDISMWVLACWGVSTSGCQDVEGVSVPTCCCLGLGVGARVDGVGALACWGCGCVGLTVLCVLAYWDGCRHQCVGELVRQHVGMLRAFGMLVVLGHVEGIGVLQVLAHWCASTLGCWDVGVLGCSRCWYISSNGSGNGDGDGVRYRDCGKMLGMLGGGTWCQTD